MGLNFSLPNLNFVGKVVVAILVVFLAVRMSPANWGIKNWFTVG